MKRIIIIAALATISIACSRTEYRYEYVYNEPILGSTSVDYITEQSAVLTGSVSRDGGKMVSERGFYLSTSSFDKTPPSSAQRIVASDSPGEGKFSMEVTGLDKGTKYYVCSYAVNEIGKTFSDVKSFSTLKNAKVILEDAAVTCLNIFKNSLLSSYEYYYNWDLKLSVGFEDVASLASAGVCVDGNQYDYSENLPSSDGEKITITCTTNSSVENLKSINAYAYAYDKKGGRIESENQNYSLSTMGICLKPEVYAHEADWYSEPDKNYYVHYFTIGVRVITGSELISELGVFPTSTYLAEYFTQESFSNYTFYCTTESVRSANKEETLKAYGKGKLSNGWSFYGWDFNTGNNEATSSYGADDQNFEVFFTEDFADGIGKFSVTTDNPGSYAWEWDSSNKLLKANAYSNGASHAAYTMCTSDIIDLTNRSNAQLMFYASAKFFTDLDNEFKCYVYSVKEDAWYSFSSLGLKNDNGWQLVYLNLGSFVGGEIRIAFLYTGTEESCGSIWVDDVELISSMDKAGGSAAAAERRAGRKLAADVSSDSEEQAIINKKLYENTRRKSLR